jgi:hypothetical protein
MKYFFTVLKRHKIIYREVGFHPQTSYHVGLPDAFHHTVGSANSCYRTQIYMAAFILKKYIFYCSPMQKSEIHELLLEFDQNFEFLLHPPLFRSTFATACYGYGCPGWSVLVLLSSSWFTTLHVPWKGPRQGW